MEDYKHKYEQALERARRLNEKIKEVKGSTTPPKYTVCEAIFPELKESEDGKKIKNEIIDYLKGFIPHHNDELVAKSKVWIAWLEKQGEQKPVEIPMTLDEAIAHCKEKSCDSSACALQHKQLAQWLTELKEYKRLMVSIL